MLKYVRAVSPPKLRKPPKQVMPREIESQPIRPNRLSSPANSDRKIITQLDAHRFDDAVYTVAVDGDIRGLPTALTLVQASLVHF